MVWSVADGKPVFGVDRRGRCGVQPGRQARRLRDGPGGGGPRRPGRRHHADRPGLGGGHGQGGDGARGARPGRPRRSRSPRTATSWRRWIWAEHAQGVGRQVQEGAPATIRLTDFADLAFSPDRPGSRRPTASTAGSRCGTRRTGDKLYSIPSHGRIVTAVAFAPDGGAIAAAGGERRDRDLSVRLWPGQTDPEVTTFRGHTAGVWSAVFLPDGERVVSVSGTGFEQAGAGPPVGREDRPRTPLLPRAHEHRVLCRGQPGRQGAGDRQRRQDGPPLGRRDRPRVDRCWRGTRRA